MKRKSLVVVLALVCVLSKLYSQTGTTCNDAQTATIGTNNTSAAPMWFEYTPTKDTVITISSCIDNIDTEVAVYNACNGEIVVENDDNSACFENNMSSRIKWEAEAGITYKILWTDKWTQEGFNWELEVSKIPTAPVITNIETKAYNTEIGEVTIEFTNMLELQKTKYSKARNYIEANFTKYLELPTKPLSKSVANKSFIADGTPETEPNDGPFNSSVTQAISVGTEINPTKITGHFGAAADPYDWFEITLNVPTKIMTTAELADGEIYLWVSDSDYMGSRVEGNTSALIVNNANGKLLQAGTYYVFIQPNISAGEPGIAYNLKVWSVPPPTFVVYRDGVAIDSTPIDKIYTDKDIPLNKEYCYEVSQVLDENSLSEKSNKECTTLELHGGEFCHNAIEIEEGIYKAKYAPMWYRYMANSYDTIVISSDLEQNNNTDTYLFVYANGGILEPGNNDADDYVVFSDDIDSNMDNRASDGRFLTIPGNEYLIYWHDEWSADGFDFRLNKQVVKDGDIFEKPILIEEQSLIINGSTEEFNDNYSELKDVNLEGNDVVYSFSIDSTSFMDFSISAENCSYVLLREEQDNRELIKSDVLTPSSSFEDIALNVGNYILIIVSDNSVTDESFRIEINIEGLSKADVSFSVDMSYLTSFDKENDEVYLQTELMAGEGAIQESMVLLTDANQDLKYTHDTSMFPYTDFEYQYYINAGTLKPEWTDQTKRTGNIENTTKIFNDVWAVKKLGTEIIEFKFAEQISPTIINADLNKIDILVKESANLASLLPTIVILDSATISPNGNMEQDFTSSFEYIVESFNGDSEAWTVNVSKHTEDEVIHWREDFSDPSWQGTINADNLYNGSVLPNQALVHDNTNMDFNWHWSTQGPRGKWTAIDPLVPDNRYLTDYNMPEGNTIDNGFAMLESDFFNTTSTGEGVSPERSMDTYIQFGPIDLSKSVSPYFSLNQLFRFCCWSYIEAYVEISNDFNPSSPNNGNWHKFSAKNLTRMGETTITEERHFQVDISEVAAGESSVYIRISQSKSSYYYWIIDDLKIAEGPVHDLEVENYDITYNTEGYFYEIPEFLNPTITNITTAVFNRGLSSCSSFYKNINISLDEKEIFSEDSWNYSVLSNATTQVPITKTISLDKKGKYTIVGTLNNNVIEANVANNSWQNKIFICDSTYSKVDSAENIGFTNSGADFDYYNGMDGDMCAQAYNIANKQPVKVTSISARVGKYNEAWPDYSEIEAGKYKMIGHIYCEDLNGDIIYTGASTMLYTLKTTDTDNWVNLSIEGYNYFGEGKYFVAVETFTGSETNNRFYISASNNKLPYYDKSYRYVGESKGWHSFDENFAINLHLENLENENLPIRTIQETVNISGESPLQNSIITTSGIITGIDSIGYYLQDGAGIWNGIYVMHSDTKSIGDSISIKGEVIEKDGITQITNIEETILNSENNTVQSLLTNINTIKTEQYESVLVELQNLTCVSNDVNNGQWELVIEKDTIIVDDNVFAYKFKIGNVYNVTGVVDQSHNKDKILPRGNFDVVNLTASDLKQILSFELNEFVEPAKIDTVNNTVIGLLKVGADLTALSPTITISDWASINPNSEEIVDFADTVIYTVTAEDNSAVDWKIKVEKLEDNVTITVVDGDNLVVNALVTIDTLAKNTNDEGIVKFTLKEGLGYKCYVSKDGYLNDTTVFDIATDYFSKEVQISLITYSVRFIVSDKESFISDATVKLIDEEILTNEQGTVEFLNILPQTGLEVSVIKEGYQDFNANYDVTGNEEFEINLTKTNVDNQLKRQLKLYPNPTTGVFNLILSELNSEARLEVINCLGQVVYEVEISTSNSKHNLNQMPKGNYYVKIVSNDIFKVKQLVIE